MKKKFWGNLTASFGESSLDKKFERNINLFIEEYLLDSLRSWLDCILKRKFHGDYCNY